MKQPETHEVPLQTWPVPQLEPSATVVQLEVLVPGWHDWQALVGFVEPDGYTEPPMSHCVPHSPLAQT
jgi:hypothetical protein